MTLVKHSQRTLRRSCAKCGAGNLYLAHDTDRPMTPCQDPKCANKGANGRLVYMNHDGSRHADSCTGRTRREDSVPPAPVPVQEQEHCPRCGGVTEPSDMSAHRAYCWDAAATASYWQCWGCNKRFEGYDEWTAHVATDCRSAQPPAEPQPEPQTQEETVTVPPQTEAPADVQSALSVLASALSGGVDESKVRAIVADELRNIVFPTRTVVVREGREETPREIPNAHRRLADVIKVLSVGEHVMMVGPAGTGKSTIASQAAEALELSAYAMSLSPQTSESKVFGYRDANGAYHRTLFREAFEHGGVFNFDEIDNGHPSILAAINAALANGHCAFPDGMVERHRDFRCVASANTYGRGADRKYVGRQQLDAATLDRFTIVTIEIDEGLEQSLCEGTGASADTVSKVLRYVRKLRATAEREALPIVLSPRATVGMCRLVVAGFTFDEAVDMRVRRGLTDADWAKVTK